MNVIQRFFADRRVVAWTAINLALLLSVVVCFNAMVDARDAAVDRDKDAVDCERAAMTIESLRGHASGGSGVLPGTAALPADITRRVQEAGSDSAVLPVNIRSISPQPPKKLGDSSYSEVSTQIELSGLPLKKTLSFIEALCSADSGLRLTMLHLTAARSGEDVVGDTPTGVINATAGATGATWAVELTVASTTAGGSAVRP